MKSASQNPEVASLPNESRHGAQAGKRVAVIHNRGQLANQLWLAASVYAYCLERGYDYANYTFYRYESFFDVPGQKTRGLRILNRLPRRATALLHRALVAVIRVARRRDVLCDDGVDFELPPTDNTNSSQRARLAALEASDARTIYLDGWLFRNTAGLEEYRAEIRTAFRPRERHWRSVMAFVAPLRQMCDTLVGVHVRRGDYRQWAGGAHLFSFAEARRILDGFLLAHDPSRRIRFVICSDEPVDAAAFAGLPWVAGPGGAVEDLYTLSAMDLVIGSTSTFGPWAAYYGSVPFVEFLRGEINWTAFRQLPRNRYDRYV